jgi:hypothetical protein
MGNLELCVNYDKKRSLELWRSFLAEGRGRGIDELIAGLSGPEREQYEERAALVAGVRALVEGLINLFRRKK